MIRIIAGTLVDVGLGRFEPQAVKDILDARDRTKAGKTAPAQGLTLETIYYPDNLQDARLPLSACFPRYPVTNETWPEHFPRAR